MQPLAEIELLPPAPPGAGTPTSTDALKRMRAIALSAAPVLLIAAVIAARNPSPLFRAEFWAEDATEFLFGAVKHGAKSLAMPVYGYHFLLSRAVAYLATFAPVFYAPYVYAWGALVANVASVSYVTREGFSWIAPRRWQRVVLALTLAVGPGTSDVFLNLANLPNALAVLGFLLLIERPFVLDRNRMIALVVLTLSSGQMILWLPLVAFLAWSRRSRAHAALAAVIAVVGVLNGIGSRQASSAVGLLADIPSGLVARILVENAFLRMLPAPFLGSGLTSRLMASGSIVFWSAAIAGFGALAALLVREYRRARVETVSLVLAYGCAIGGLGVIALSRNYAVGQLVRESGEILWDSRYALVPGTVAIVFWAWWLLRERTDALRWKAARTVAAGAIVASAVAHWNDVFRRPDLSWPQRAARVQWVLDVHERTGRGAILTIRDLAVHPVGWLPNNRATAMVVLDPR
jgi:hypothetical protein